MNPIQSLVQNFNAVRHEIQTKLLLLHNLVYWNLVQTQVTPPIRLLDRYVWQKNNRAFSKITMQTETKAHLVQHK